MAGLNILVRTRAAALEEVHECLEDIGSLQEDFNWVVVKHLILKFLALLEHSLRIAKLKGHREIKDLLFILLRQRDERHLALLLEHLGLVHGFHVLLVDRVHILAEIHARILRILLHLALTELGLWVVVAWLHGHLAPTESGLLESGASLV